MECDQLQSNVNPSSSRSSSQTAAPNMDARCADKIPPSTSSGNSESNRNLRLRLNDVTDKLSTLEEVVASEALRKRLFVAKRQQLIADSANRIQDLLKAEVVAHEEACKQLEESSERLINEMSVRTEEKIISQMNSFAAALEGVISSCERWESGISGMRSGIYYLPDSVATAAQNYTQGQKNTEASEEPSTEGDNATKRSNEGTQWSGKPLVRKSYMEVKRSIEEGVESLQEKIETIRQLHAASSQEWSATHRNLNSGIRELKKNLLEKVEDSLGEQFSQVAYTLRSRIEEVQKDANDSNETYKMYIPAELATFRDAICREGEIREDTDDAVVKALNEYNTALQNGFSRAAAAE